MTDSIVPLVFLDANVLAKPVTRTLVIYASHRSSYEVTWSEYVEREADRHLRTRQVPTHVVRDAAGLDLSPAGRGASAFTRTQASDRQVLADAVAAGASFIVTEDVDDFDEDDVVGVGIAAVNPDVFLAERSTLDGYVQALTLMSGSMTNPPRTPAELHIRLGRQHPRLVAAHRAAFDGEPCGPTHPSPALTH